MSTAATRCPLCGEPYFKPDSYLQKVIREQEEQARVYIDRIIREQGPELRVLVSGDIPWSPDRYTGWWYDLSFDGKRFSNIGSRSERLGTDTERPTHLRLKPDNHTVIFTYFQGKSSSQTFTTGEASRMITLIFKKNLLSKKYMLESVAVL